MSSTLHRYQGGLALGLSVVFWLYYTIWVIVTPFYDNTWVASLFPERKLAVQVPVIIGSIFACSVAYRLGRVVAADSNKT